MKAPSSSAITACEWEGWGGLGLGFHGVTPGRPRVLARAEEVGGLGASSAAHLHVCLVLDQLGESAAERGADRRHKLRKEALRTI